MARASGKYIPTLCWLESISAVGACRLCIVEVSGVGRLLPACTTPVQDGMSVTTNSEKLTHYRRIAIEFLFSERNHQCAVCVSNNHCELQAMAQRLGVTSVRYPYAYPKLPVDVSHERYVLDHNRCILCTRCVRVCAEVEGAHVWDVSSRGIRSHDGLRHEPALGPVAELHQLRQVRAGLPHRRAGRKGLRRGGNGEARPQRDAPGRPGGEATHEEESGWRRCGWTAAPAATCRCSIWTKPFSPSPSGSTWSTARWWMRRSFPRRWTSR